jgi:hypothetical protein
MHLKTIPSIQNVYKIFVTRPADERLKEILNSFDNIKSRIFEETKAKKFSRLFVDLTDEEIVVIKLAISSDEISITIDTDMNAALFDAHFEIDRFQAD